MHLLDLHAGCKLTQQTRYGSGLALPRSGCKCVPRSAASAEQHALLLTGAGEPPPTQRDQAPGINGSSTWPSSFDAFAGGLAWAPHPPVGHRSAVVMATLRALRAEDRDDPALKPALRLSGIVVPGRLGPCLPEAKEELRLAQAAAREGGAASSREAGECKRQRSGRSGVGTSAACRLQATRSVG